MRNSSSLDAISAGGLAGVAGAGISGLLSGSGVYAISRSSTSPSTPHTRSVRSCSTRMLCADCPPARSSALLCRAVTVSTSAVSGVNASVRV